MTRATHFNRGTITTVSGVIAESLFGNVSNLNSIFIKAASGNTIFDVKLTNQFGDITREWTNNTGELNETGLEEVVIDEFTLTIFNASKDEAFTYLLKF